MLLNVRTYCKEMIILKVYCLRNGRQNGLGLWTKKEEEEAEEEESVSLLKRVLVKILRSSSW